MKRQTMDWRCGNKISNGFIHGIYNWMQWAICVLLLEEDESGKKERKYLSLENDKAIAAMRVTPQTETESRTWNNRVNADRKGYAGMWMGALLDWLHFWLPSKRPKTFATSSTTEVCHRDFNTGFWHEKSAWLAFFIGVIRIVNRLAELSTRGLKTMKFFPIFKMICAHFFKFGDNCGHSRTIEHFGCLDFLLRHWSDITMGKYEKALH